MNFRQATIGVLMGGESSEREVSLRSGRAITDALCELGYRAVKVELNEAKDYVKDIQAAQIDVGFVALHGEYGEDGCIQGVLECLGIPYTGADVLASALCMDKWLTKTLLVQHDIPTPKGVWVGRNDDPVSIEGRMLPVFGYPVFVKPRHLGSTVAAGPANNQSQLIERVTAALKLDSHALIEERIEGIEVTVALLDAEVLGAVEIVPHEGLYDYTAKYTPGQTSYFAPPRLPETIVSKIFATASRVQQITEVRSSSRVDMIVSKDTPYVLEVNTSPGMNLTSLVPRIAESKGITYAQLCEKILSTATRTMPRHT